MSWDDYARARHELRDVLAWEIADYFADQSTTRWTRVEAVAEALSSLTYSQAVEVEMRKAVSIAHGIATSNGTPCGCGKVRCGTIALPHLGTVLGEEVAAARAKSRAPKATTTPIPVDAARVSSSRIPSDLAAAARRLVPATVALGDLTSGLDGVFEPRQRQRDAAQAAQGYMPFDLGQRDQSVDVATVLYARWAVASVELDQARTRADHEALFAAHRPKGFPKREALGRIWQPAASAASAAPPAPWVLAGFLPLPLAAVWVCEEPVDVGGRSGRVFADIVAEAGCYHHERPGETLAALDELFGDDRLGLRILLWLTNRGDEWFGAGGRINHPHRPRPPAALDFRALADSASGRAAW